MLADAEIYVRELTPIRADLESVFLELTHDTARRRLRADRPTGRGGAA